MVGGGRSGGGVDGGVGSSRRDRECRLKEGEVAYVHGELSVTTAPDGISQRRPRSAEDGRKLRVSNFSEEQRVFVERLWLWIGAANSAVAAGAMIWAYFQRYHVVEYPGVLR